VGVVTVCCASRRSSRGRDDRPLPHTQRRRRLQLRREEESQRQRQLQRQQFQLAAAAAAAVAAVVAAVAVAVVQYGQGVKQSAPAATSTTRPPKSGPVALTPSPWSSTTNSLAKVAYATYG
jgi:negative regulator of sigma E activity